MSRDQRSAKPKERLCERRLSGVSVTHPQEMGFRRMAKIDRAELLGLLEKLDGALTKPTTLCVIGSCALLLMGHTTRSTEDVDVWVPASSFNGAMLIQACQVAEIGFNPTDENAGEGKPYLQVVQPGVVRLPSYTNNRWATGHQSTTMWRGRMLTIVIPPVAVLVASKLARCEDRDLLDCEFLMTAGKANDEDVRVAARKMPSGVRTTVLENVVLLGLVVKAA